MSDRAGAAQALKLAAKKFPSSEDRKWSTVAFRLYMEAARSSSWTPDLMDHPRCGRHALLALRAQVAIAVAETLLDKAGEAQAGPRCIGCLEPVAINEPDCGATACRQVWLFDRVGTLS